VAVPVAVLLAAGFVLLCTIGGMGREGGGFELGSGWPALRKAAVGRLDGADFFCGCGCGCGCGCTEGAGAWKSGCVGGARVDGFAVVIALFPFSFSFSFPLSGVNPKLSPKSPSPDNEIPESNASDHSDKSELSAWCNDNLGGSAGAFFVLDVTGGLPDPEPPPPPEPAEDTPFVCVGGGVVQL
jgi:hypothetical protein